jgi:hypothetical protein
MNSKNDAFIILDITKMMNDIISLMAKQLSVQNLDLDVQQKPQNTKSEFNYCSKLVDLKL